MNRSESFQKSGKARCHEVSPIHVHSLALEADDGQTYCLSTAQYLDLVIGPNPVLAQEPEAPPERAVMRFGDTEVVVLGSGLRNIQRHLATNELALLRSMPARFGAVEMPVPFIVSIQVHRTPAP